MQIPTAFLQRQNYFFKWHGTGNDFIIVNGIEKDGKIFTRQKAKSLALRLCHRKFGIGADGLLIVRLVEGVYKMEVINSDGSEPNMCGNGLRCFVSFLYHQNMIPQSYDVLTDDGLKPVRIQRHPQIDSSRCQTFLVELKIGKGGQIQQFDDERFNKLFLTTIGVPHLIIFLTEIQFNEINFEQQGKKMQKRFDANINFCLIGKNGQIRVKTFERGAGMTYSCGTGVSSVAYVAYSKQLLNQQQPTIAAITDGGQIFIRIDSNNTVTMNGPAQLICQGQFHQ